MAKQQVSNNKFGPYKWIVDGNGLAEGATHTTIAAAITSASSGDDIFIRPGTYTEDLTLKDGVNLIGGVNNDDFVEIVGKITFSVAASGECTLAYLRLRTNGDYCLVMSGSNANSLTLDNCDINANDHDAINFTNSSASSILNIEHCNCDPSATYKVFVSTAAGIFSFRYCHMPNGGGSTAASTSSAGVLRVEFCEVRWPITTSSTNRFESTNSFYRLGEINTTALTIGGSGSNYLSNSYVRTGTASAISVSSNLTISQTDIQCSNTNSVTGAGTVNYCALSLSGTSTAINPTTATQKSQLTGQISFDEGSNYLDYYETGTFTPTIAGATTAGTPTYSIQYGDYVRVGKVVHCCIFIEWTAWTGSPAGNFEIQSLPFTCVNPAFQNAYVFPIGASNLNWSGTGGTLFGSLVNNTTRIRLFKSQDGVTITASESVGIYSSGTASIRAMITYFTNA